MTTLSPPKSQQKISFRPHNYNPLSSPTLPPVDLATQYPFSHPVKQKQKATWKEEWYKIVIAESPYNDLAGPIVPPHLFTPGEIAAKKTNAVKRKLGIPAEGLIEGYDPVTNKKEKKSRVDDVVGIVPTSIKRVSELTLKTRGANHTGRRGGIFAQMPKKPVKRVLKLTKDDQAVMDELDGQVPLKEWRNELSHIQMALGSGVKNDDDEGEGEDEEESKRFGLTELKLRRGSDSGEEQTRRPENVAMDDFELPRYDASAELRPDPKTRANEDEFVYPASKLTGDKVHENRSWKNFGVEKIQLEKDNSIAAYDAEKFVEQGVVKKFIEDMNKPGGATMAIPNANVNDTNASFTSASVTATTENNNDNDNNININNNINNDNNINGDNDNNDDSNIAAAAYISTDDQIKDALENNKPLPYKPLGVMEGPPVVAPPSPSKHTKNNKKLSKSSTSAKGNTSRQRLAKFLSKNSLAPPSHETPDSFASAGGGRRRRRPTATATTFRRTPPRSNGARRCGRS